MSGPTLTFGALTVGERFLFRDDRNGGGRGGVRYREKVSATEYATWWLDGKTTAHSIEPDVPVRRMWQ